MVALTEVSTRYCEAASCEALYEVRDAASGLLAFIALHDLAPGPGCGGIRRMAYGSALDGVRDVVRLAEQMSLKTALAELPCGGAKAVILDHAGLDVETAYAALGEAVERLGGVYFCGADVGTSEDDLVALRRMTGYVNAPGNAPGRSTARGVVGACRAALRHVYGTHGMPFTASVQGVGSVGSEVAMGLAAMGGRLRIADIVGARVDALVARLAGATAVAVAEVHAQDVSLFAPCAVGPVISAKNLNELGCRIVCGAANSQLAEPGLALALAERDVLYVPDFAINAGAVIEGALSQLAAPDADPAKTRAAIDAAIEAIGPRMAGILAEATEEGLTPLEVALSRAHAPDRSTAPRR